MTTRPPIPIGVPAAPHSEAQLARVRDFLEERCGLDFGESRRTSLQAALRTRMEQLGIPRLDTYYDRLCAQAGDDELRSLINLVTITETCFFRDPAQFRMLRRHILPTLLAARGAAGSRSLRIWSAGCSSGEEPYSIALTLLDMGLPNTHPAWTLDIVGTDVNTERLDAARRGVYSARAVRNVEGDCLARHFTPVGRQFQLQRTVREAVRFEHGSLTQEQPARSDGYDLVLCKNVAIYFRPEVTRRLVRRLYGALNEGGYLLLGHSESLWMMEEGFTLVEYEGVFCYRKPSPPALPPKDFAARQAALQGRSRSTRHRRLRFALPDEPTGQYQRCLEAFRAGDWAQAEAGVQALLHSSPGFVPAHLLVAGLHVHLGRLSQAREEAEHVLRVNDLEPRAHLLLGMVAARAGRQDDGVEALRRALHLDESLALAYFWLGNLYRARGDIDRACEEYAAVVTRYECRQLDFTEEFAADLRPAQIVDFCRQSVRRLRSGR